MMKRKPDDPIEILLVEDNPGDARLAREALRDTHFSSHLSVVEDGVEAMDYLKQSAKYAGAPRPDIILLDLNLPRKSGREVLYEIKSDPDLRRIPVIVLTTSTADQDIEASYDLHANCYITKPLDINSFVHALRQIETFWFTLVTLSPR